MKFRIYFDKQGAFAAMRAAEAWCVKHGISFGPCDGDRPRALAFGDFDIGKWSSLRPGDIAAKDGRMTGDMRTGPVTIELKRNPLSAVRRDAR